MSQERSVQHLKRGRLRIELVGVAIAAAGLVVAVVALLVQVVSFMLDHHLLP